MKLFTNRVRTWSAVVLLLGVAPAVAQQPAAEHPRTVPSRDVDVDYTITRNAQTLHERTRWMAEGSQQRIDTPNRNMHLIMDLQGHQAWLVDDDNKRVMDMRPPNLGPLDPANAASFTRLGAATIAGLSCTEWETTSGGPKTELCLTEDGVLLRVQTQGRTLIEANTVTYGPVDAGLFQVPPDYTHVAPPIPRPPAPPPG